MMKSVVTLVNGIPVVNNVSAIRELYENNCTMPNVRRVIYNLKTTDTKIVMDENNNPKREPVSEEQAKNGIIGKYIRETVVLAHPILTTIIEYIDDTRTVVKNTLKDKIEVEQRTLEDGSVVTVATDYSKEIGFLYAMFKRICGTPTENGTVDGNACGKILRNIVEDSYDEQLELAKTRILKNKAKKLHQEKQKNAKPKAKKYSIAETLARFNALLDKAEAGDSAAQKIVEAAN